MHAQRVGAFQESRSSLDALPSFAIFRARAMAAIPMTMNAQPIGMKEELPPIPIVMKPIPITRNAARAGGRTFFSLMLRRSLRERFSHCMQRSPLQ